MKNLKSFLLLFSILAFYQVSSLQAMVEGDSPTNPEPQKQKYAPVRLDLNSFDELPSLSKGDILLQDLDSNTVSTRLKISEKRTASLVYEKNKIFLEKIKTTYGEKIHSLFKDARSDKPRSTEKKLPKILEDHSKRGAIIIPFSSRTSNGIENTKKQLIQLGFNHTAWNGECLKIKEGMMFGDYTFVQNMLLNKDSNSPNKGLASSVFLKTLEEGSQLPSALFFTDDDEKNIEAVFNANPNPPVPLFLYHYKGEEKYFDSSEEIKAFYKETIKNFHFYEKDFDKIFKS